MRHKESGASMVEAAIVFPVFILLTFAVLEISHYWYVSTLLDHMTSEAAWWLSKQKIERGIHESSCASELERCDEMKATLESLGNFLFKRAGFDYVSYRHYNPDFYNPARKPHSSVQNLVFPFYLLRPGEAVQELDENGTAVVKLPHPLRVDYATGLAGDAPYVNGDPYGWPGYKPKESWIDVLDTTPSYIGITLRYKPLLPVLPPGLLLRPLIRSSRVTLRRIPYSAITSPGVLPTNTPKPTATPGPPQIPNTPTPTPYGGGPTPTPTPFPQPTPTPTPTPTIPPGVDCNNSPCTADPCACVLNPGQDFCTYCPWTNCIVGFGACG